MTGVHKWLDLFSTKMWDVLKNPRNLRTLGRLLSTERKTEGGRHFNSLCHACSLVSNNARISLCCSFLLPLNFLLLKYLLYQKMRKSSPKEAPEKWRQITVKGFMAESAGRAAGHHFLSHPAEGSYPEKGCLSWKDSSWLLYLSRVCKAHCMECSDIQTGKI